MRISQAIAAKRTQQVFTIRPEATVREMLETMAEHNVGALVVSTDGAEVEGIVSERDVVRALTTRADLLSRPVSEIMTAEVHTCEGHLPVTDLMKVMTEKRIRHVPVLENGRLKGVISIGDVVKSRMQELEFERDQLDSYVHTAQT